MKRLLPLRKMVVSFGLLEEHPKSLRIKRGRKSFFTPEGRKGMEEVKSTVKRELAGVRATAMEGLFGFTMKNRS